MCADIKLLFIYPDTSKKPQNCRCTLHKEIVFSLKIATIIFFREQCRDAASRKKCLLLPAEAIQIPR
jgi:hypothetical protein